MLQNVIKDLQEWMIEQIEEAKAFEGRDMRYADGHPDRARAIAEVYKRLELLLAQEAEKALRRGSP